MKILIAEDDRITAQLLSRRLTQLGYQTVVAFDAMQTLMSCQRQQPDVLILDLHMPGGNGLHVLQRLKNSRNTLMLPVIVLTAHGEQEAAALAMGADMFLAKPPDFAHLEEILERFQPQPSESRPVSAAERRAPAPVAASRSVVRNVLLVEDDRVAADLMAQAFKRAGYATILAPDVADALRALNASRIDAVVLDMQLPGGSGLDVIQKLRSNSRTSSVPILVVSGTLDDHAAEFALAAGADGYFQKPPDVEQVIARLGAHFAAAASERAAG